MAHFRVRDAEARQGALGEIADRDDLLDREQFQQCFQKWCTGEKLGCGRNSIRKRTSANEWMKRKCVPQQRQRIDMLNRCPHHGRAGLGRSLRPRRRFAIAALGAEKTSVDAAEHDLLARERNSGKPPTAITRCLADEQHARRADLAEIQPQVLAANCAVPILIAGAIGDFHPRERVDEAIEPPHGP